VLARCSRPTPPRWPPATPSQHPRRGGAVAGDRLLDDRCFLAPFRLFFDPSEGRPSLPIETYLPLNVPQDRHQLVYEPLAGAGGRLDHVARLCRIGLEVSVPDESTIRMITCHCDPN
jgi:IS5 family transposase